MHKIMTELHQDHINLTRLLALLENQVAILAAGEDADLLLMTDIVDYIRRYSDQIHHPKEDEIFRVFSARSADAGEIVASLMDEHQALPVMAQEFQGLLDSLINDTAILSRQALQDKLTAFIAAQQEHLNIEETELFPLINNTLQDADWAAVEQGMQEHGDPLFGSHVLDRYRNLHKLMNQRILLSRCV
jgi:hemerythrin-like domain-containing protein